MRVVPLEGGAWRHELAGLERPHEAFAGLRALLAADAWAVYEDPAVEVYRAAGFAGETLPWPWPWPRRPPDCRRALGSPISSPRRRSRPRIARLSWPDGAPTVHRPRRSSVAVTGCAPRPFAAAAVATWRASVG